MLFEFFFFWSLLIIVGELSFSRYSVPYTVSLLFAVIGLVSLFLLWNDFDLFGSILLAIYSSVLILISLFLVYFSRYWGRLNFFTNTAGLALVDFAAVLLLALFSYCGFSNLGYQFICDSFLNIASTWEYSIIAYDYFIFFNNGESMTAAIMHQVLYKFFITETFFLNVYLLLGLVLTVVLLIILKSLINPGNFLGLINSFRFSFFSQFPSNVRMRAINKFRRQLRRKNSSNIKFK